MVPPVLGDVGANSMIYDRYDITKLYLMGFINQLRTGWHQIAVDSPKYACKTLKKDVNNLRKLT